MSNHHTSENHLLLIEKVLLLKSLSIFEATPETVLTEVAEILEEVEMERGTHIFKVGDIASCMYIICKGEIKIHKDGHTLATLKENDFFGELSLLDTDARSANATADTDVFLLQMNQEPFYELMENRIEVARGIIKTLCRRLREQNIRNIENSLKK
jgi:CRP/FNR family cyclic AMP-dependent transcriptional regulator